MILKLEMSSAMPIYAQLRNQIVLGIGSGSLKIGEKLPTVRQMAEDLSINMMTVTKAYTILKNEGYIEIDRRHGAKVSACINLSGEFKEKIESELSLLAAEVFVKGMDKDGFLQMCEIVFDRLNSKRMEGVS